MLNPLGALTAANRDVPVRNAAGPHRALVVGGGGALGAAVLEQLLAGHRYERVGVLAQPSLQPALRGLHPVADDETALARHGARTALIVYDRERHANGRDAAFVRPLPQDLPARAAQLLRLGVQSLLVVVPHAPALLPQALKTGLASLDEGAVASLGFAHLVFMRMAQAAPARSRAMAPPERLAAWLLGQMQWMVPQREQPVRAVTVARVAAALAAALPDATPGTRVLPPEVLWLAAQASDRAAADTLVGDWLAGRALQAPSVRQRW